MAIRLRGPLDAPLLESAMRTVLQRYPVLRTRALQREGALEAVIDPVEAFALRQTDAPAELDREIARSFRLAAEMPFRAMLVSFSGAEHILVVTAHGMACDRRSLALIFRELGQAYGGAPLPEPARVEIAGDSAGDADYWRLALAPMPEQPDLQQDQPGLPPGTAADGSEVLRLDPSMMARLRAFTVQEKCPRQAVALAAFAALLEGRSRQSDLVLAVPVDRRRAQAPDQVGPLSDFAPARLRFEGDPSFRRAVDLAAAALGEAAAHPGVSFTALARQTAAQAQLAQVLVRDPEPLLLELRGVTTVVEDEWERPPFALSLELQQEALQLRYASRLFAPATARRMLVDLRALLDAALRVPDQPLSALPMLDPEEERKIVFEWNATATPYPRERCVHELFEAQVRSAPDAIAIELGDLQVTYRELDGRAIRLARELCRLGVAPGELVGLCAERGIEAIAGMLAILKAGAAYLPIDPAYPAERILFMLEDAQVRVLLAQPRLVHRLPSHGAKVISLDAGEVGSLPGELPRGGAPDQLAYAMFTSGSTGRPKAVAVPHRAVVRLVKGTNFARIDASQTFLQSSPISFDASTLEIWGPLLNGGKLAILPGAHPSLQELGSAIRRHGVTSLWLTAGLFQVMVDERPADLLPLQQLLAGGDVLSVPHVTRVLRDLPALRLINGYGPTENTTFSCCHTVDRAPVGPVPIGRPISNSTAYVLDHRRRLLPSGVAGELYVGGEGLALGYVGRPELTAEKFVETRFGRMYRTGDLARWTPEGVLEFLGRIDTQVKVRGFRVELGEIEAVLALHEAVREAAVAARDSGPGDKRLVAWVVLRRKLQQPAAELRAYLSARLPDYMVPSAFAVLESLPLGATGKVDRRALPEPEAAPAAAPAAAKTGFEQQVAKEWRRVLGREEIGLHDNFFELGGSSLLLVQVHSRLERLLGRELPIVRLFEFPTIASLARHLEGDADAPSISGVQDRAQRQRAAVARQAAQRRGK